MGETNAALWQRAIQVMPGMHSNLRAGGWGSYGLEKPLFMVKGKGARVTDVEGLPHPSKTFYVATAAGGVWKTTDAGESWEGISVPHGDVHDLWIHPDDQEAMIVANDGGARLAAGDDPEQSWHNVPLEGHYSLRQVVCQSI